MAETLRQLKARAMAWPSPYHVHARRLMADAAFDLMQWPKCADQISEDLRESLQATAEAMQSNELP